MRKEKKINYHDTDAVGIAYYGSYLAFLEESRTRFLEEKGISVKGMHEDGEFFVVKSFKVDYKSPVRFGEIIICDTKIRNITEARICFSQTVFNKTSQQVLVESEVVLVVVGKDLKPMRLPEAVNSALCERTEGGHAIQPSAQNVIH